jgi:hypothetical protein
VSIDSFSEIATVEQAPEFSAACAERACVILFWTVSWASRDEDLDAYVRYLEMLWHPDVDRAAEYLAAQQHVEGMRELVVGDELTGAEGLALFGAIMLRTGLARFVQSCPDRSAWRSC